jgi:hypothetical protein
LKRATTNLEPAFARQEPFWQARMIAFGHATAGLTFCGQDVDPLHHADILMVEGVAMRDKAPGSDRMEISPIGNRSGRRIIDVHEVLMIWIEGTSGL